MTDLFLKIVNMSISATWFALAVLLLRLILKKAPKWVNVLLWGLVAVRLICPFSPESILSLIPSAQTVSPGIMMDPVPSIESGIPPINSFVNPILGQAFAPSVNTPQNGTPQGGGSGNPLQIWIPVLTALWAAGIAAMLIYSVVSYLLLRRRIRTAVLLTDNIFQSENIPSPFVLGVFRPRIYLPFGLSDQDTIHIIAHENAHIKRRDNWWKPFSFALLSIHWLNPVMWLAYALLCRDIELACDEKVIREFGIEQKACYSQTLLSCSINRRIITACPIAFGEVGVKERVKSVLNYKKPRFWVIIFAIVACAVAAVCFLTNPKKTAPKDVSLSPALEDLPADYSLEQAKADGCVVMEDSDVTSGQDVFAEFVSATNKGKKASVRVVNYYTLGDPEDYDEEFYESIKDDYPSMYVHDLVFDGNSYTIRWYEEEKEIVKNFRYLMNYEGSLDDPEAYITHYKYYVLTNDDTVTWDDILFGMLSSQSGDYIAHFQVYSDLTYKNDAAASSPKYDPKEYSLEELPDDYSLEQAKLDGCVVIEGYDTTSGKNVFAEFLATANSGKEAFVRVVRKYTAGNTHQDNAEYVETVTNGHTELTIKDLKFDGNSYAVRYFENGKEVVKKFKYLMNYAGRFIGYYGALKRYDYYVLTNDNKVTYTDILYGIYNQKYDAAIYHHHIYYDLIYENEIPALSPKYNPKEYTLEELPDDYSVEQAIADGCVVMEDGDVTSGQDVFAEFAEKAGRGEKASVRTVGYFTIFLRSSYELYQSTKNDYPRMFIRDIVFDGDSYTIRWYERGKEIVENYKYLMHFQGEYPDYYTNIRRFDTYFLSNDNTFEYTGTNGMYYGILKRVYEDKIYYYELGMYDPAEYSLEELPADYSLDQAKADGCVVMEDSDITSGEVVFSDFTAKTSWGEAASVRIVKYYTTEVLEFLDNKLYQDVTGDCPLMKIYDLVFDGSKYTLRWYEDGKENVKTFKYLMRCEWEFDGMRYKSKLDGSYRELSRYDCYVLTDDNTLKPDDSTCLSPYTVFSNLIYDYELWYYGFDS